MTTTPRDGLRIAEGAEAPSRPSLRWRGGKWRDASRIIELMPPHECYVEPYGGAASVLLRKPRADFEVYNDINGGLVNFFRVLRERTTELQRAILLTPYAKADYHAAREPCPENPLEWARRVWVQCSAGRGRSVEASGGWRFQRAWNGWGMDVVEKYRDVEHFTAIVDRLLGVQIEQAPALEVLARWDAPATLFYIDPPYELSTRPGSQNLYAHEMEDADHEALAEALHAVRGMVLLSGYEGPLYQRLYADWECARWSSWGEAHKRTTECLWSNPAAVEARRASAAQTDLLEGVE
jgi:DNA adenine methylase